jgi:hypothetical protein
MVSTFVKAAALAGAFVVFATVTPGLSAAPIDKTVRGGLIY